MLRILAMSPTALLALPLCAQSGPESVARAYLDAFNAGDAGKVASFNSPTAMDVVDEFAPFAWSGAKAFSEWSAAFDAHSKAEHITEPVLALGTMVVRNVTAGRAYLLFASSYAYKQKRVAMRESGTMALVLDREGNEWKVASWTWAGSMPKPAHP